MSQGFTTEDLNKNKSIWEFACSFLLTICLCCATAFRLKKSGINLKYLFGETSVNKLPWLMLFTIFFGLRALQSGISQLTIFILNLISPEWAETALENANSSFSLNSSTDSLFLRVILYICLVLTLIVVAPITEEFIFRGVLLHRFGSKWGITPAILISSLLFGLAHWNYHVIGLTIVGIAFALIYVKTKSLGVSIILHSAHNGIAFLYMIASALSPQNIPAVITYSTFVAGVINTVFGSIILFYFFRWPSSSDLLPYEANSNH
jgi:uncharacterized protein